jgi:hypothetical protein
MKWGSGSDLWGRERLIATTLEGDASVFEKECCEAFELVEHLYKEWAFKLGVSEKSNGVGRTIS